MTKYIASDDIKLYLMTIPIFGGWGHRQSVGHIEDSSIANTAKLQKSQCFGSTSEYVNW